MFYHLYFHYVWNEYSEWLSLWVHTKMYRNSIFNKKYSDIFLIICVQNIFCSNLWLFLWIVSRLIDQKNGISENFHKICKEFEEKKLIILQWRKKIEQNLRNYHRRPYFFPVIHLILSEQLFKLLRFISIEFLH